ERDRIQNEVARLVEKAAQAGETDISSLEEEFRRLEVSADRPPRGAAGLRRTGDLEPRGRRVSAEVAGVPQGVRPAGARCPVAAHAAAQVDSRSGQAVFSGRYRFWHPEARAGSGHGPTPSPASAPPRTPRAGASPPRAGACHPPQSSAHRRSWR